MRIPEELIQEVLQRCDAPAIIGRYVALQRKGNRLWGISPFKNEKTPSFTVDENTKLFYCFSTAQGGSVFTFLQKMENISFMEAVRMVAKEVGVKIPDNKYDDKYGASASSGAGEAFASISKTRSLLTRVRGTFEHFFWETEHAKAYMQQERGFEDATLRAFGIGYAPSDRRWLHRFLRKKGYGEEELAQAGLFSKNYPETSIFSDRIMFPIMSLESSVIAFGGRLLSGEGPKYINSPQTDTFSKKRSLYGLPQSAAGIKNLKQAFLVEGYLDVMALHQAGVAAAVAPLGTAFTEEQAQLLHRMTSEVVIAFDDDEAGQRAAVKSASAFEKAGMNSIKIVRLPENDPADILLRGGKEALREALLEQREWFEYYIEQVYPSVHATFQQKDAALSEVLLYLSSVHSPYKKSLYVSHVADVFRVDEKIIYSRMQRIEQDAARRASFGRAEVAEDDESAPSAPHRSVNQAAALASRPASAEFLLMASLCTDPSCFEKIRVFCKAEDLSDERSREVYLALENAYRNGALTTQAVLETLPEPVALLVTKLIASGEAAENPEVSLEQLAYYVKLGRLERLSRDIDMKIRKLGAKDSDAQQANQQSDKKQLQNLLEEKKFYVQRIGELKKEQKKHARSGASQ